MVVVVTIVAGVTVLLVLVLLGTMREVVILRGDIKALSQLITNPPAPPYLGKRLPAVLVNHIPIKQSASRDPQCHIVLFLRAECGGCEALCLRLEQEILSEIITKNDISCVVYTNSRLSSIFRHAQSISNTVILDDKGKLVDECDITGMPTQLAIWVDSLEVFDYQVGGSVEWILTRLHQTRATNIAVA
jgi:hypothetical protein